MQVCAAGIGTPVRVQYAYSGNPTEDPLSVAMGGTDNAQTPLLYRQSGVPVPTFDVALGSTISAVVATQTVLSGSVNVSFSVNVTDPSGIHLVEFLAGATVVASTSAPDASAGGSTYTATWLNAVPGAQPVTVRVTNGNGQVTTSVLPTTIEITPPAVANPVWSGSSGSWLDSTNWNQGSIPTLDPPAEPQFTSVDITQDATVTLDQAWNIQSLSIADNDPGTPANWIFNSGSGGSLVLQPATEINVSNMGAGCGAVINAPLSGAGASLLKTGKGTLTLLGSNTYNGGTIATAGNLNLGNVQALGTGTAVFQGGCPLNFIAATGTIATPLAASAGNFTVAGVAVGANVAFTGGIDAGTLSGSNTVLLRAGAVNGAGYGANSFTLSSGTFNFGSAAVNVGNAGGNIGTPTNPTFNMSGGTFIAGSFSAYGQGTKAVISGGTMAIAGNITGQGDNVGSFTIAGGDVTANAIAGTGNSGTQMTGGTLRINQVYDYVANSAAGNWAVLGVNGGTVVARGNNPAFAIVVPNANNGNFNVLLSAGTNGMTIDSGGYNIGIVAPIGNISGAGNLITQGSGTITLNWKNTYTGNTTVLAGALAESFNPNAGAATTGAVSGGPYTTFNDLINNASTLVLNGGNFSMTGHDAYVADAASITGTANGYVLTLASTGGLHGGQSVTVSSGSCTLNAGTFVREVVDGTRVLVSQKPAAGGGGTFNFTGQNAASSSSQTFAAIRMLQPGMITVNQGANGGAATVLTGTLTGGENLSKAGNGTLTLTGSAAMTGSVSVLAGTLALTGSGSLLSASSISVSAGAVLDATGRPDGTLTLGSAQSLSGLGIINGNLSAGSGTAILAAGQPLSVTGTATLSGNLVATGTLVGTGDYVLLSAASRSGTFNGTVSLPTVAPGYSSQLLYTATSVLVRVTSPGDAWLATNAPGMTWTTAPNHDGWTLLHIYALGGSIATPNPPNKTTVSSPAGNLQLSFNYNTLAADVQIEVQTSPDVVNWTTVATKAKGATTSWTPNLPGVNVALGIANNSMQQVTATAPSYASNHAFMRIKLTR